MRYLRWISRLPINLVRLLTFILTFLILIFFERIISKGSMPAQSWGVWIFLAAIALIIAWLCGEVVSNKRARAFAQVIYNQNTSMVSEQERRISALLNLNHGLVNSQTEKEYLDIVLEVISKMVGAVASSFAPLDEIGRPLPAITYGIGSNDSVKEWSEHLASEPVRQRCKVCLARKAVPGDSCPLINVPLTETYNLFCLPVSREDRTLGMLSLYLPINQQLPDELSGFINDMLNEVAIAILMIRLRNQEFSTLKQMQLMRTSKDDFNSLLDCLLEGLQNALEVEGTLLYIKSLDEFQPEIRIRRGNFDWLGSTAAISFCEQVMLAGDTKISLDIAKLSDDVLKSSSFEHVRSPENKIIGVILVVSTRRQELNSRQRAVLQTMAAQAALMVENERLILTMEYNTIIQERTRLAREIHDGLAQTLAFLKLQAAQMQNYLSQGDLNRLSQVMKQNYSALAEAYLDTREAIDNLRITPQQGLITWLDQVVKDFEQASGIQVDTSLFPPDWEIPPEIQAQLIRIVQEALNNIRKHADAKHVGIYVYEWQKDLVIEVRDDGKGFSADDVPIISQYGLRGMRERAELIGAEFQIISKPLQGTVIRLQLPRLLETSV
jgi:two-component system nitrate/nitrite sensor histidine kinase NarX